jgi:hypothetical protein
MDQISAGDRPVKAHHRGRCDGGAAIPRLAG